jgi:hypothetical protein
MPNPSFDVVLAGASAGHYKIPKELTEMASTIQTLEVARRTAAKEVNAPSSNPNWVENGLAVEAIERVRSGRTLKNLEHRAAEVAARYDAVKTRSRVLAGAVQTAEAELRTFINGEADKIISEHLMPALEETLTRASTYAAQLEGIEPTADAVIADGDPARVKAFNCLSGLASRYAAVHACRKALTKMRSGKPIDSADAFGEFAGIGTLYPQGIFTSRPTPWPQEPVPKLLWLVENRSEAKPWVPTRPEQDAAVQGRQEEAAEREQEMAARQRAAIS